MEHFGVKTLALIGGLLLGWVLVIAGESYRFAASSNGTKQEIMLGEPEGHPTGLWNLAHVPSVGSI
jgi:hypothetical protein